MNNILFIAPPAAGKGTFSELIKEKYGYLHISTGDLLREEVKSGSDLGKELSEIMSSGKLVSDDLIKRMLENKLTTLDKNKPFIMDGYPRTLDQVKDYEEILEKLGLNIGKAIYLKIDKETGLKRVLGRLTCPKCKKGRVLGRLTCPKCKKGYNKLTGYNMPKVEWICDDCKVELESRVDDTEEAYNIRYDTYMKETKPIIEYFKSKNNLIEIDSTQDADSTMKEIEKWLV